MNSTARAPQLHTNYLAAILNGLAAPRDGSQSWLRPATKPNGATAPSPRSLNARMTRRGRRIPNDSNSRDDPMAGV